MEKDKIKKIFKTVMLLKLPFTIYLVVSLAMVPGIGNVSADVVKGAHRGASLEFEENTLEAFEQALKDPQFKFIEFDLTYTKDMQIVVIHQNTMLRMPKNNAVVRNLTYEELQTKFEHKIPTYEEVMNLIDGQKPVQIEIKSTQDIEKDKQLVEFVIQDIKTRGITHRTLIASPTETIIEYIEQTHPEIKTDRVFWITLYSILPFESTTSEFYESSDADYFLLHGYNIHNYETLIKTKPADKNLVFWYFTDEMYLVGNIKDCIFWEEI